MQVRINYSIIFVSDMQRSISFYRDTVGIPLKFESPGWTEFKTEGTTLALHLTNADTLEQLELDTEPPGTCRAGFQVPDINEFHARMTQQNVQRVQLPSETLGATIAQYVDPDGMVFSVSGG